MSELCQHCKLRRINRARKLCWTCYYDLGIRALYIPKVNSHTDRRRDEVPDDPTEEELERMIAEQLPTMPKCTTPGSAGGPERRKRWRVPLIRVQRHRNRSIE